MLTRILIISLLVLPLQACDYARPDLKSPCAGADGSPCGPKRSVNDWWLHSKDRA